MDYDRAAHLAAVLEGYRLSYINGDKSALLEAVECCAMFNVVMPEWVAAEFVNSHRKWKYLKVKTMDEAFQVERKPYFNINKARKWQNKAGDVYLAFLAAERRGLSINLDCAEAIARQFGINRQDAWNMYEDVRKNTLIGKGLETTRKKTSITH